MDVAVLEKLRELGAQKVNHVNGSLLAHLQGTHDLLRTWGCRDALCKAGLYHSVYGTAGFQQTLIGLQDRKVVAALISEESEQIVYLFSACDRDFVYSRLRAGTDVEYRDRFSRATRRLPDGTFADLCELTIANELEIARWRSVEFLRHHCDDLRATLASMLPYVSSNARQDFARIFADPE